MGKTHEAGNKKIGALTQLQWTALGVALKGAGKFRPGLTVGPQQPVDFCVRIAGPVTVCGDQMAMVTDKPDLAEMLGVVLTQLGPLTRQKVTEAIEREFTPDPEGKRPYVATNEATELVENLLIRVSRKKPQPRSGNVTGDLLVELIEA
jgi:hypothetical protein